MSRLISVLVCLVPLQCFASAAPASRPAVESKLVEKDGVAVCVVVRQPAVAADGQPHFFVRFTNRSADYVNLYDVEAFFDWQIRYTAADKHAGDPGPWQLRMDKIPHRYPIAHKQIKPGESLEVEVNLNDPPFTFDFVYIGVMKRLVAPVRRLRPGKYKMAITVALQNPFGPGYHEWAGPLTTEAVDIVLSETAASGTPSGPTTQEISACDKAIDQITDKLGGAGGLWMNGVFPSINLPPDASHEDVIASAVNRTSLDSKAYRILRVRRFEGQPNASAALVRVGKTPKVVVFFPAGKNNWWTRFYDTELAFPATQPAATVPSP